MNGSPNTMQQLLISRVDGLRHWLDNDALPLWWANGAERPNGGFYERLGQDGMPVAGDKRRARVQPRQAYCYAAAGKRGWNGPWTEAVTLGLNWFDKVYRRDSGLYGNLADEKGKLIDPSFDLYNQAFALFSGAAVADAMPEMAESARKQARQLLSILRFDYAHPIGGFEEDIPHREPLLSNPHMHLFEAALAWEAVTNGDQTWTRLADEIAQLAMSHFIDAKTGALREYFAHDWTPLGDERGHIVEPGHQFEWAWLLARWGELRGRSEALAKAERLFAIGEMHGVCPIRKVAVMQIHDDFSLRDPVARFWGQTEWLKAALRLAVVVPEKRTEYLHSANRALNAMAPFMATPISGLWYDKLLEDGTVVEEPAPASTFYHIVCAIHEAEDQLARL